MRTPLRTAPLPLLALASLLATQPGCLFFEEEACADPSAEGCSTAEPPPETLVCDGDSDPNCKAPRRCQPDPALPCDTSGACALFCLPELEAATCEELGHLCNKHPGEDCEENDDCLSRVCAEFQPGNFTCLQACTVTGGQVDGCDPGVECKELVLRDGRSVNFCDVVYCSSDRKCEELGLGRCVVHRGLELEAGVVYATCSTAGGEDDTGHNCSLPDEQAASAHSDACPVRGLCHRWCEANSSEGCKQGFCTRPCEVDSDCPERLFCRAFLEDDLLTYFPRGRVQFKVCMLPEDQIDYQWGCKDDVDCCSGLFTGMHTAPATPEEPEPQPVSYPLEYSYWFREQDYRRCCIGNTRNECEADPSPYSVETHCGLISTPGGPADQPPPRMTSECRSNRDEPVPLALPGAPCTDGTECLTRLCVPGPTGGVCTTPCYTESWPNSPDRPPTCPPLPDGTARLCCPGRAPFFDLDGVSRSCAAGESCPGGTECWQGSCQVCIATCQVGDSCPADSDPTCTGPL